MSVRLHGFPLHQALPGAITECVSELPDDIRYRKAIPRIVRELFQFMERERISWEELCKSRMLDFGSWKAEMV